MASITPSLMDLEAPIHGENVGSMAKMSIAARIDDEVHRPSLDMPGGEDQDLL